MKRWPSLLLIVALVAGAIAYDQRPDREQARRASAATSLADLPTADDIPELMPQALPPSAAASTWFCAGGTATGADPSAPAPPPPEPVDGEVAPVPEVVADHVVVMANPTERRLIGVLTAYPSEGDAAVRPVELEPGQRKSVRLADVVRAPYVAATVELEGGGAVVEHELRGPLGFSAAPCASSASSNWYFAAGSTERGASEVLVFFNPFPSDAVVDVSFATDQGPREPRAFQDLPIPARSVRAVPVTDKVTIRSVVAASVVVRIGRLVVDRIQTWDGTPPPEEEGQPAEPTEPTTTTTAPPPVEPPAGETPPGEGAPGETPPGEGAPGETPPGEDAPGEEPHGHEPHGEEPPGETPPEERTDEVTPTGPEAAPLPPVTRKGLTVSLGLPRPAATWLFPDAHRSVGASLQYVVYNPTERRARVELQFTYADPEKHGGLDPTELTVAPGAVEVFDVDDDVRVVLDTGFHATITASNGVPVIAEQVTTGRMFGADGGSIVAGSTLVARRWQFAAGTATDAVWSILVLFNPGERPATVEVAALDPGGRATVLQHLEAVEVPPGLHLTRVVNDSVKGEDLLLRVTSDRPIVAERTLYRTAAGGFSASLGIPVPGDVLLP